MQEITEYLISGVVGAGVTGVGYRLLRYIVIKYFKNIDQKLKKLDRLTSAFIKLRAEVRYIKNEVRKIKKRL